MASEKQLTPMEQQNYNNQASGHPYPMYPVQQYERFRYGEFVTYDSEVSQWYSLSIVQIIVLLWYLANFVVFILESQTTIEINLWIYMIIWSVLGFILVVVIQTIVFIQFMAMNRSPDTKSPYGITTHYMGIYHVKELLIGWITSIFSFSFISWLLIDFLLRHKNDDPGEGCCSGGIENRPDITDLKEFRVYHTIIALSAVFSFITILVLIRTIYAHYYPTRIISGKDFRLGIYEIKDAQ